MECGAILLCLHVERCLKTSCSALAAHSESPRGVRRQQAPPSRPTTAQHQHTHSVACVAIREMRCLFQRSSRGNTQESAVLRSLHEHFPPKSGFKKSFGLFGGWGQLAKMKGRLCWLSTFFVGPLGPCCPSKKKWKTDSAKSDTEKEARLQDLTHTDFVSTYQVSSRVPLSF